MSKREQPSIFQSFAKVLKTASSDLPSLQPCAPEVKQKTDHAVKSDDTEPITIPQISANDVSSFVAKDRLIDEDRATILTKHFTPEKNWKGPLRQFGEKMRHVPALVFDKDTYPTLSYTESEDSVYCADCVAFSASKVILSS